MAPASPLARVLVATLHACGWALVAAYNPACVPPGIAIATVKTRVGDFPMAVFAENDKVSKSIMRDGHWEIDDPAELARLAGTTPPAHATVFLDIGANLGFYSLLFAKFGYQVVAMEPMYQNRRAINASLCLNPDLRERVRVLPVAIGHPGAISGASADSAVTCIVRSSTNKNLGNGIMECGPKATSCATSDPHLLARHCDVVQMVSLDEMLRRLRLPTVDVVKIDVEGAECDVFAGGQQLFATYRPQLVQVETKQRHVAKCFRRLAAQHKYRIGKLAGHDMNRVMAPMPRAQE